MATHYLRSELRFLRGRDSGFRRRRPRRLLARIRANLFLRHSSRFWPLKKIHYFFIRNFYQNEKNQL